MAYPSGLSIFDPTDKQIKAYGITVPLHASEKILWLGTPSAVGFYFSSMARGFTVSTVLIILTVIFVTTAAIGRLVHSLPVSIGELLGLEMCVLAIPPVLYFFVEKLRREMVYLITDKRVMTIINKWPQFLGYKLFSVELTRFKNDGNFIRDNSFEHLRADIQMVKFGSILQKYGNIYFYTDWQNQSESVRDIRYDDKLIKESDAAGIARLFEPPGSFDIGDSFPGVANVETVVKLLHLS